ncbi:MAG: DUF3379 family protein [Moraxellaceae bacterium]|nr:DUF3379 family protein [Moraxellaceae bacterium]
MSTPTKPPEPAGYACLDFRRDKLATPRHLPAIARQHLADCPLCQTFARRTDTLESRYADALQIAVPEGLADRVILRTRRVHPLRSWKFMALAASVVLSVVVSLRFAPKWSSRGPDAAEYAIRHVMHEPQAFHTHIDVDPARIQTVLASFGGELQASLGKVRYIRLCPIEGAGTGWHIVFETPHGLATLLLVPTDGQQASSGNAQGEGMQALVRPAGQGYYAVIADSSESIQSIDEAMRLRVRWKS